MASGISSILAFLSVPEIAKTVIECKVGLVSKFLPVMKSSRPRPWLEAPRGHFLSPWPRL